MNKDQNNGIQSRVYHVFVINNLVWSRALIFVVVVQWELNKLRLDYVITSIHEATKELLIHSIHPLLTLTLLFLQFDFTLML